MPTSKLSVGPSTNLSDTFTGRTLLVSNRLPVSVEGKGPKARLVASSGGLVTGLGPVHEGGEGLWIGNLDVPKSVPPAIGEALVARRLICVPLDKDDAQRHYEGYSNQVLWPLCHYMVDHVDFSGPDYEAYARVNQAFADVVAAHAKAGDRIWVHDYHLMLLPQLLRERLPDVTIGFFLHIPFPSSEVFRILPRKEDILRGLLGANLIGLHTYDDARHLTNALRRVLGVEFDNSWQHQGKNPCKVGVFPLGVDTAMHQRLAQTPAVDEHMRKLRERLGPRRVLLGVDRMDYTKGLPQRLDGFASLLRAHPHWQDDAVLLQLAVPSRASLASYQTLKEQVEQQVGQINGSMQAVDGNSPVRYFYRSVSPEELTALYLIADVMLVTPLRDGMNLVAKEYLACRTDDTGVLVLSEFAGAAAELEEALIVNPYDPDSMGVALNEALTMPPADVAARMGALRARVRANTVHHWVKRFLVALSQAQQTRPDAIAEQLSEPNAPLLRQDFAQAPKALLALDYDGTLAPFAGNIEDAAPSAELLALLADLSSLPGVEVAIISGRSADNLQRWLGHLPLHLIGEHGYHVRYKGAAVFTTTLKNADLSWQQEARELMADWMSRTRGATIENKPVSVVWHYRRAEPAQGLYATRELEMQLRQRLAGHQVSFLAGNKVLEVRASGFDKGLALKRLREDLGPFAFVLAMGDDTTDEDMFRQLHVGGRRAADRLHQKKAKIALWSVQVGDGGPAAKPTAAAFRVPKVQAAQHLLFELLQARRGPPSTA
jgi:trehalose 6-phosphate synthase/phosphatase